MKLELCWAAALLAGVGLVAGCASSGVGGGSTADEPAPEEETRAVFNRYNIHYYTKPNARTRREERIASYANYVQSSGHGIIPPNTAIEARYWQRGFAITLVGTGETVLFEYNSPNMDGMTVREYVEMITSPEPVNYDHLSDVDKEGIEKGVALKGMTKEGVMVALGYPARHRTPSPDADTWYFWKNRFSTMSVVFKDGKVSEVLDR